MAATHAIVALRRSRKRAGQAVAPKPL